MIANLITLARIALVPFVLWVVFAEPDRTSAWRWLAVLLFVLSAATDGVDGAVARKRGEVTNLGKLLDPIADKLLIGGVLVSLSMLGEVAWWVTLTILVREIGITVYRFAVIKSRVIAANGGGKLKTVMQSIMVGFLLSPSGWMPWGVQPFVETVLIWVSVLLTVWTGIAYLVAGVKK